MYYKRIIDKYLKEWADRKMRKPILLRGARQVGKSSAVKNLSKHFENYVEINFERQPEYKSLFKDNLVIDRIISQISAIYGEQIIPGKTLLFLDEIQSCPEAIMSLRFFKEDIPDLHVIAAGSLLEFALEELPTFGVGRIHSMFMYPMTFDEFLNANGDTLLIKNRDKASADNPLPQAIQDKLTSLFRTYMLIGGMPEVVSKWVETHDYIQCQEIQDDIVVSYEDDFPKYHKKVDSNLLRLTLRSVATQTSEKFTYAAVGGGYRTNEVKRALEMLTLSGIVIPVYRTAANGLPLGGESDTSYKKMLIFDSGLLLRLLNMTLGDVTSITKEILTSGSIDLVNKGPIAELIAGLELLKNQSPNIRHDLYYWARDSKNSLAEVDYISTHRQTILPIEVKAGTQGGMKSLWIFMREKRLDRAIRCSLENFGTFKYTDQEANNSVRNVYICPLYAMSMLDKVLP
ncbi:MAG: AAA family ATPase [Pseudoflavonifractor sp.]|nr:AAA family ATPase [Pseudoflavonifractor sp.]